jgi:vacuolar protein sorting-associated protein 13D
VKIICNIFEPTANIICFSVACLLDVMQIELVSMDLYAGRREAQHFDKKLKTKKPRCALELGSFCVNKWGPSLLREKCQLKLQVERNLDTPLNHDGKNIKVISEQLEHR